MHITERLVTKFQAAYSGFGSGRTPTMTESLANNALERQQIGGGRTVLAMKCVLAGAEDAPWWAAQQDR